MPRSAVHPGLFFCARTSSHVRVFRMIFSGFFFPSLLKQTTCVGLACRLLSYRLTFMGSQTENKTGTPTSQPSMDRKSPAAWQCESCGFFFFCARFNVYVLYVPRETATKYWTHCTVRFVMTFFLGNIGPFRVQDLIVLTLRFWDSYFSWSLDKARRWTRSPPALRNTDQTTSRSLHAGHALLIRGENYRFMGSRPSLVLLHASSPGETFPSRQAETIYLFTANARPLTPCRKAFFFLHIFGTVQVLSRTL